MSKQEAYQETYKIHSHIHNHSNIVCLNTRDFMLSLNPYQKETLIESISSYAPGIHDYCVHHLETQHQCYHDAQWLLNNDHQIMRRYLENNQWEEAKNYLDHQIKPKIDHFLNHFEGIGIKKLKKYDNLSKYLDEKNSKSVPKSHLHYLDEDGYDSLIKKLKNKTNELTEKKEKAQKELKDMRNYGKQEAQQNIEVKQQIIALKQEWNQYYASFFNT